MGKFITLREEFQSETGAHPFADQQYIKWLENVVERQRELTMYKNSKNRIMSRQHHYLKTETEYYQAVERGEKKFELRRNDRNFQKHDMMCLEEVVNGVKTGRSLPPMEIQYVLKGGKYGLNEGFCIINW